jgi:hypothetical protein
MKVRTCQAKKEYYSFSRNRASRSKVEINDDLDAYKFSIGYRTRRKRATSQELDVITASSNLVYYFDVYIQQLNNSIAKAENMTKYYENEMKATCRAPTLENLGTQNALNVSACDKVIDVFDTFGCYMKSLCRIANNVNSDQATTTCLSMGGNPFGPLSFNDYGTFKYFIYDIFGTSGSQLVHIGNIFFFFYESDNNLLIIRWTSSI